MNTQLEDLKKEARSIHTSAIPSCVIAHIPLSHRERAWKEIENLLDRTWNLAMERAKFIVEQNLGIGGDYDGSEKQKKNTILAKSIASAINKEKV